ncbi:sensor histidine kinase [Sunxiuqinia elliptica]|uniref:Histidine kinase/DNA gyrase B/HSP90-like ATPase n=1 Tax=Sunxiuqinia elliptica TaxID=655355 RepID=A0A4R6HB29_9BACT|nr:HAMP domain-containing sensor histidine kinase [Sunxiuqinia elliptica]TDO05743.1 histidine kinase/DNA gyrase B/HSP90-like ATPase [Sunxiuqinia elliptica]TDO65285.1 histidine kinase/DNA gyrase B/HSP90-like ATPase [Sunxiuqinia elliptica]
MSSVNRLASREPLVEILKSRAEISGIEYIKDILASMSSIVCILNKQNQIVFSNDILLQKYNFDLEKNILGVRPGEVFKCVNANNETGGCGTSERCEYCGARTAFDEAWEKMEKVIHECKITSRKGDEIYQLDLEVSATPVTFEKQYLIVAINDITEQNRKILLERIFFHDILNIAGSLQGVIDLVPNLCEEEQDTYLEIAGSLTEQIIDEIKGQQQMIKAESGELQVHLRILNIEKVLNKLGDHIRFHNVSHEKKIKILNHTGSKVVCSDETLLTRVLLNMVKNAMEAVQQGEEIVLEATDLEDRVRFSVHNNTYIPREIQLQIFQRSYSTKGNNRGVGTYSMKLLGESYLKGCVGFTSTEEAGTTFFIDLPKITLD